MRAECVCAYSVGVRERGIQDGGLGMENEGDDSVAVHAKADQ